jgi:hypothetical protein
MTGLRGGIVMGSAVRRIICCGGIALIALEAVRLAAECRRLKNRCT